VFFEESSYSCLILFSATGKNIVSLFLRSFCLVYNVSINSPSLTFKANVNSNCKERVLFLLLLWKRMDGTVADFCNQVTKY